MRVFFLVILILVCGHLYGQVFFPVKVDKKWGLINAAGQIAIAAKYDAIGEFQKFGYAVVRYKGGVGLINRQGETIVKPQYNDVNILDSLLFAVKENFAWKVINTDGKVILEQGFTDVRIWSDRYLGFSKNQKWGMADFNGTLITEAVYDKIEIMDGPCFGVYNGNKKGVIDLFGKAILPVAYEDIKLYEKQVFFFKTDQRWGIANLKGEQIVPPSYKSYKVLSKQFIQLTQAGNKCVFSLNKEQIIADNYDHYFAFSSNLLLCKRGKRIGLINYKGATILKPAYHEIQLFSDQHFRVKLNGKWAIYGKGDQEVIPFEYDYISPLKENNCVVRKSRSFGIMNKTGELVLDVSYTKIVLQKKKAKASKDGIMSLVHFDKNGYLKEKDEFKKHITLKIKKKPGTTPDFLGKRQDYILDKFEWFYSVFEDKWGLRRLEDGLVQIHPAFDWIEVRKDLGFTIVGIEKISKYDFEYTSFRFEMVYGLVNNNVGLLTTNLNLWDIRLEDLEEGLPVARCTFDNGRHGVISSNGKILRKDFAYIGKFKNGMARMSLKGQLSGTIKRNKYGLGRLKSYLASLFSPNYMLDYTQYDEQFKDRAQLICDDCLWGYLDTLGHTVVTPRYTFARDFVNNVGIVANKEKWGLVSDLGERIIECQFDDIQFLQHTGNKMLKIVSKQKKYGLIDTLGRVAVNLNYDEIGAFNEGMLAVNKNGMWGFVDKNGTQLIPCKYQKVKNFKNGLAAAKLGNKWGYIDTEGKIALKFKYNRAGSFNSGLAWVAEAGKVGFINKKGYYKIKAQYEKAFEFELGVARVVKDGKYGLLDTKGDIILKPKYSDIAPFNRYGLAVVSYGKNKTEYGLINRKGLLVTNLDYQEIRAFREGFAAVKYKNEYGFVNHEGQLVIDCKYFKVSDFSEGRVAVQLNGKCGYINKNGYRTTALEFSKCMDYKDGKAVVYKGYKKTGLLDKKGNYIIEPSINRLLDFSDGRGLVRDKEYRFYYITEEAESYESYYQDASEYQHGVAVVQSEGQWGIINQKGIAIIPPKYDKIGAFKDGYAKVRIKNFNGLINLEGKMIVNPEYEYISYAGQGLFRVEKGEKLGYFTAEGNWIWALRD